MSLAHPRIDVPYSRAILELPGGMRVMTPWIISTFVLRTHILRYVDEGAKLLYVVRCRMKPTVSLFHETPRYS